MFAENGMAEAILMVPIRRYWSGSIVDLRVTAINRVVTMRFWILMSMIFVVSACHAETTDIKFSGLLIPNEYVVQAPDDSSEDVYDDEAIPIALAIEEAVVKREIPQYQIATRGAPELHIVVYPGVLNTQEISDSVLSEFSGHQENIGPDEYSQNRRYYRSNDNWLLVSESNGQRLLVAQCSRTGIYGNVEGCDFRKNIDGYGVSYHLEGSNLALVREFDEFIATTLASWKEISK